MKRLERQLSSKANFSNFFDTESNFSLKLFERP